MSTSTWRPEAAEWRTDSAASKGSRSTESAWGTESAWATV